MGERLQRGAFAPARDDNAFADFDAACARTEGTVELHDHGLRTAVLRIAGAHDGVHFHRYAQVILKVDRRADEESVRLAADGDNGRAVGEFEFVRRAFCPGIAHVGLVHDLKASAKIIFAFGCGSQHSRRQSCGRDHHLDHFQPSFHGHCTPSAPVSAPARDRTLRGGLRKVDFLMRSKSA